MLVFLPPEKSPFAGMQLNGRLELEIKEHAYISENIAVYSQAAERPIAGLSVLSNWCFQVNVNTRGGKYPLPQAMLQWYAGENGNKAPPAEALG